MGLTDASGGMVISFPQPIIIIKMTNYMENKYCLQCQRNFVKKKNTSNRYWGKSKFCSDECRLKNLKFINGHIPWNKELKGIHLSVKTEFKKGNSIGKLFGRDINTSGNNNNNWRGDNVGISALHSWCKRNFIKPNYCEKCGRNKQLDLSNNGIYNRKRENWEWLCRRCHKLKDSYKRILEKKPISNNKSGHIGVCWDKERNKWLASIGYNGKKIKIGRFVDKNDAINARLNAVNKYFGNTINN
jgi:hypothetical protein